MKRIVLVLVVLAVASMVFAQGTPGLKYSIRTTFNPETGDVAGFYVERGTATAAHIVIPETHNGLPVIGIGDFGYNTTMTGVTIPNSVLEIGYYAFGKCTGLTNITIPSSVLTIGGDAFEDSGIWNNAPANSVVYADKWAVGVKGTISGTVELRNDTVGIARGTFEDITGLTGISLPNTLLHIGSNAFRESGLTSLTLPSNVKHICSHAFRYTNISSVTIPNSVVYIGEDAFSGTGIYENSPENSVVYADKWAVGVKGALTGNLEFRNNTVGIADALFNEGSGSGPTSVTIPSSVVNLGYMILAYTDNITSVTIAQGNPKYKSDGNCIIQTSNNKLVAGISTSVIPNYVTSIGTYAFAGNNLTSITIPNSVTRIEAGAFSNCRSLSSVAMSNRVTYIGVQSFRRCTSLSSITIPNSVTFIGEEAFMYTSFLTNISIPSSVAYIADYAFYGCTSLTINAQASSKPAYWEDDWNILDDDSPYTYVPVNWGATSDNDEILPAMLTGLVGNYPNPFNPTTTISFDVAREGQVIIDVYNVKGQLVRTLVNGNFGQGNHTAVWNGTDNSGRSVGSGVYFYRMNTEGFNATKKMMLMK